MRSLSWARIRVVWSRNAVPDWTITTSSYASYEARHRVLRRGSSGPLPWMYFKVRIIMDYGDQGLCAEISTWKISQPSTCSGRIFRHRYWFKKHFFLYWLNVSKTKFRDKSECDLLIVIGSSLKVRPVALIPSSLPPEVPQILINRCLFLKNMFIYCQATWLGFGMGYGEWGMGNGKWK